MCGLKFCHFFLTLVGSDEVQAKEEMDSTQNETEKKIDGWRNPRDQKRSGQKRMLISTFMMLNKTIDTILLEEFTEPNMKMKEFRKVLTKGVLLFAEKHKEDKAEVDH